MKQIHKTPPRNDRGVTLQHIIVGVTLSVLVFGVGILGSVVWQTWFGNENVVQQAEAEVSDFFAEVSEPTTTTEPPYFPPEVYETFNAHKLLSEYDEKTAQGIEAIRLLQNICETPILQIQNPSLQLIDYCTNFWHYATEASVEAQEIKQTIQETQTG